jgi:hypothetical protein
MCASDARGGNDASAIIAMVVALVFLLGFLL